MIFQLIRKRKPAFQKNSKAYVIIAAAFVSLAFLTQLYFSNFPIILSLLLSLLAAAIIVYVVVKQYNYLKSQNKLLHAQQQYLLNAAANVNDGIIVTDTGANISYMNPAAEKLTGNLFHNIQNKPLRQVYKINNQKNGQPVESAAVRVLKTGKAIINENNTLLTSSNGLQTVITNTCNPLFGVNGDICGTVLVFKECTAAASMVQQPVVNSNPLIQNLPYAVYLCDANGFITNYNSACTKIWGKAPKLNAVKWCGSQKLFYADGAEVLHEDAPMALAIRQKRSFEAAEITLQQHTGKKLNLLIYSAPVFNANGSVSGAVNTLIDVTETQQKEQLARYNEDRYYTLAEQAAEAIFITDADGNLLETNMQAAIITGYTRHELRDMNIARLFPKDDFKNNFQLFKKILSGTEKLTRELIAVHKNKQLLNVRISAKKLSDGRLMAIVNDVTELTQTAKSLAESEQLNTSILTTLTAHIGVINQQGVLVTANKAWKNFSEQFGKTTLQRCAKGENLLTALQIDAACGDKTAAGVLDGLEAVKSGRMPQFEHEYICPLANEVRWFALRINPFANNAGKFVIEHVDITKAKTAENEIGNYRLALNQSCIMDIADCNGVITDINDNFLEVSGYGKEEIIGKTHSLLDSGHHSTAFYKTMWSTLREGKVWTGEIKNRKKNGETFWVNTTIIPCLNEDGIPSQFISIRTNITKQKLALEKMQEAVERFEFLSKATSDTIWDWDITCGKMLYNEAVTSMLGYKKPEVLNINNWWKLNIHPDDINDVTKAIDEAFAAKKQNLQLEYRFRCENGHYKNIFDRAFILYNTNGTASRMIGAMQDVTYQKQEEQRISNAVVNAQEAERQYLGMELHDNINQLLTGTMLMLSAASHAQMSKEDMAKIVVKCRDYVTSAVEEIRNLSHRLSPSAFTTSLQQEFQLLLSKMEADAGFNVQNDINLVNEMLLPLEIKTCLYRILQEQLSNICKHAGAKNVHVSLIQFSKRISLKITDDGVGFNTKTVQQGIGLSNIKKRVAYFSGKFSVTAAEGRGCTIEVELPDTAGNISG